MHNIQTEDKILFYLCLHRITFLSLCEKEILLKELDDFNALALLSKEEISRIIHRQISEKAIWNGKDNLRMAKIALEYCKFLNIRIVLNSDENYPFLLKQISDPPLLLFCRGNAELLNGRKYISVVGTRKLSAQGRDSAWNFAYQAAKNGYCVVSGLAYGADGYAHKGSVDAYYDFIDDQTMLQKLGHTIAVLPSGIDEIVPYRHKQLAQMILKSGGCIISEYEPKMNIANWHFVA
ncbi:MAG: DNA-processing protein DprA, partial [Treponema sp.]|nr:DNA-processing protein DprA [Treponema sp.]